MFRLFCFDLLVLLTQTDLTITAPHQIITILNRTQFGGTNARSTDAGADSETPHPSATNTQEIDPSNAKATTPNATDAGDAPDVQSAQLEPNRIVSKRIADQQRQSDASDETCRKRLKNDEA